MAVVTVLAAGCGGGSASAPTTTPTRPAPAWQTLTQGGIRFRVPASRRAAQVALERQIVDSAAPA